MSPDINIKLARERIKPFPHEFLYYAPGARGALGESSTINTEAAARGPAAGGGEEDEASSTFLIIPSTVQSLHSRARSTRFICNQYTRERAARAPHSIKISTIQLPLESGEAEGRTQSIIPYSYIPTNQLSLEQPKSVLRREAALIRLVS